MKKYEHLPFEVILSATEGDPEAIEAVMKFYDGYISKLCLRKLYDEHGNVSVSYTHLTLPTKLEV